MQLSMAQIPAWPRTKEQRCDEGHSDPKKKGCVWRSSVPEEKETGIVNWHWFPHCYSRSISRKGRKFSWHEASFWNQMQCVKCARKRLLKWQSWTSSWQTRFLSRKTVNKKPTDSVNSCCQSLILLRSPTDFYCFTWITNDLMSAICYYQCSFGEYTKVFISLDST